MAEAKTTKEAEKMVSVYIPMTETKQDDVVVGLNGKWYQIQRGEEVEVPEGVAEILKNTKEMDALALKRRRQIASK